MRNIKTMIILAFVAFSGAYDIYETLEMLHTLATYCLEADFPMPTFQVGPDDALGMLLKRITGRKR